MTLYPSDVKTIIKTLIIHDVGVTVDQLILLLRQGNIRLSRFTTSSIRMSFREDLRILDYMGVINLPSFPRGKYAGVSESTNTLPKQQSYKYLTRRRSLSSQRRVIIAMLEREGIPMTPKALAKACAMPRGAAHMMLRAHQVERVEHGKYRPCGRLK